MITKNMTKHSIDRFQQRGFRHDQLIFILEFGDRIFRNGSCWIVVSKQTIKKLLNSKMISKEFRFFLKQNSEKISKKVLVESIDGRIITMMNLQGRLNYE